MIDIKNNTFTASLRYSKSFQSDNDLKNNKNT